MSYHFAAQDNFSAQPPPPTEMNIALFGTSADPPTVGHGAIVQWLSEHFDQVAVWAADNPFKEHGATLSQRAEMLHFLIADLGCQNVLVDEQFSDRRSINTVNIAKTLLGENHHYLLVIGSDLIEQISRWYRAEELLQQVTLLIFPRDGYPLTQSTITQLETLHCRWQIADYQPPAVSSTEYRLDGKLTAITPAIAHYIKTQNLYHLNHNEPDDVPADLD